MSEGSEGASQGPAVKKKDNKQKKPSGGDPDATGSTTNPANGRAKQSNATKKGKQNSHAEGLSDKKAATTAFPGKSTLGTEGPRDGSTSKNAPSAGLASNEVKAGGAKSGGKPKNRKRGQDKQRSSQASGAANSSRESEVGPRETSTTVKSKKHPTTTHQTKGDNQPQKGRGKFRKPGIPPKNAAAKPKLAQKAKECTPSKHRSNTTAQKHSPALSYEDIKELAKQDPVEVVERLSHSITSLQKILNQENTLEEDILHDIITVIAKACEAPSTEELNNVLAALKNTTFLREGISRYLQGLQSCSETSKKLNTGCLIDLIKLFSTYLRRLPSSFADIPIEEMQNSFEVLEFDGKDDILSQLAKLKKERDHAIREHREKTKSHKKRNISRGQPPNDFREIPICPSVQEVTTDQKPFLRKHIKKGRFEDPEHYLDVQFRLLREDFISPLREGIAEVAHNVPRHLREQRIKLYHNVGILKKDYTHNGIVFKVQFDVSPFERTQWKSSKRLIFGSFLCISNDNFKTMFFATVANRDPEELRKGQLDIQFLEGQDVCGIKERNEVYVMAESPAYFESYRHVLSGLQEMDEDSLPFEKYLVNCSSDVDPPEYLRREEGEEPVHYDLGRILKLPNRGTVPVLQPGEWPSANDVCLNESQLEAFKAALTREFCVIQGPPGTGKTYVGAKIVQCLLQNRRIWDPQSISPMLMVCYTNHALDQFLEKVLEFLRFGIIRVGSRSKNENLARFNLKNFVRTYRDYHIDAGRERNRSVQEIKYKEAVLKSLEQTIPPFEQLEEIMNERHAGQFHKGIDGINSASDAFKLWVCNKDMNRAARRKNPTEQDAIVRNGTPKKEEEDGSGTEDQYMSAEDDDELNDGQEDDEFYDAMEYPWPDQYAPGGYTAATGGLLSSNSATQGTSTGDASFVYEHYSEPLLCPPRLLEDAGIPTNSASSIGVGIFDLPYETPPEEGSSNWIGLAHQSHQSVKATTEFTDTPNTERMEDECEPQIDKTSLEQMSGNNESFHCAENPSQFLLTSNHYSEAEVSISSAQEAVRPQQGTDDAKEDDTCITTDPWADDLEVDTIEVEYEADLLQGRRYLAGEEEDFLPLVPQTWKDDDADTYQPTADHENDDEGAPEEECEGGEGEEGQEDDTSQPSSTTMLDVFPERLNAYPGNETHNGYGIEDIDSITILGNDDNHGWQVSIGWGKRKKCPVYSSSPEGQNKNKRTTISSKDMEKASARMEREPTAMIEEEVRRIEDVWMLQAKDRQKLYWYWVSCYREKCIIDIREEERTYERLCRTLKEIRYEEEEMALRRATVIGMTTTGAARYHDVLRRIQPKIVVIEEAAEVLEAHIVTALTPETQHVIMIGDHKQLRPKATVFELAQKYNLQISLFERMVLNEMDCKRLSTQHRMRPEIAQLTKRIYSHEIIDHDSVCRFNNVQGFQENLFFIDHQHPEKFVPGLQSYSNKHEANFVVALCHYLLLQGYKPEQVTVLTMYTGQLLELKQVMPRKKFEGVRISVVDNFQGEENDIILLSLVRSNAIGFLKESNRICVALSRARQGFYCIGNFTLLSSNCPLWKQISEEMHAKRQMGLTLRLVCKTHDKFVEARTPEDFGKFPGGGCGTICDDRLDCGHVCGRRCDPRDPSHRKYACTKLCRDKCKNDHPCNKVCHHPKKCSKCAFKMVKTLPDCKHEQETECGTDVSTIICKHKCEKILPCEHPCKSICGAPCNARKCNRKVVKPLSCGHEASLPCHMDPASAKCVKPVETSLSCGHMKTVQCQNKNDPGDCVEMCDRQLSCGHICQGACKVDCNALKCAVLVKKHLPCGHVQNSPCSSDETTCQSTCESSCSRGHPCKQRCHADSKCRECTEVITFEMPECGHQREIQCHIDTATLVCQENCPRTRSCGHKCNSKCGDPCYAAPCTVKVTKELPCEHEVELPCHADPEEHVCNVAVNRVLQCGHPVEAKCHLKPQDIICKAIVEIELPCKHLKIMDCASVSKGLEKVPCNIIVQRSLPCGHQQTMQCSADIGQEICKHACDKILECGHPCQGRCGEDCKSVKCKRKTKKFLPCDHYAFLKCSANIEEFTCPRKCKRYLKCGHRCPGKCFENCAQQPCRVKVPKRLRCPRQHQYTFPCYVDVSDLPCHTKIKTTFRCGHSTKLPCDQTTKAICKVPCKKLRSCNHRCRGFCGDPCSKWPCKEQVNRRLPCGHIVTVQCCDSTKAAKCPMPCGVGLDCGHDCMGTCSDCAISGYHETCQRPCTRKLVCCHRCQASCGIPCPPCTKKCERRCEHGRRNDRCSANCTPCRLPCEKKCYHTRCNNLCDESCDRQACDAPCQEPLPCRHPCTGLCGENCPTLCRKCHASRFATLCPESTRDKRARIVQLVDCAHMIEFRSMDAWMQRPLKNVQLRECPLCSKPIRNSPRYGNAIKQSLKDVQSVTVEVDAAAIAIKERVKALVEEIRNFGRRPNLSDFPCDIQKIFQLVPHLRHVEEPSAYMAYLYSCKNHLEIIRDISATLDDLKSTATTHPYAQGSEETEVDSILNDSEKALEDFKLQLTVPEFNLRRLSELHNHVRKFEIATQLINAQCLLEKSGQRLDRFNEAKLRQQMQRVAVFVRGRPEVVDLQKLHDVVNHLRRELKQPPLPMPRPVRLVNFPGFSRDAWFKCEKGHVYPSQKIVCDETETEIRECRRCVGFSAMFGEQ